MTDSRNAVYAPYGAYAMKASYQKNLALANLLTAAAVGLVVVVGALWPGEEAVSVPVEPVVISVMDLGSFQQESIAYETPELTVARPEVGEIIEVGIPTPVPDEEFAGERDVVIASPREIAENLGPGVEAGERDGMVIDTSMEEFIPEPTAFTPTEIPPRLVTQYKGDYPRMAEMVGAEGTVHVYVWLNEEGRPLESRLAKGTGTTSLDEAAVAWAMQCTYSPGIQNGRPIRIWVTIKYEFNLDAAD